MRGQGRFGDSDKPGFGSERELQDASFAIVINRDIQIRYPHTRSPSRTNSRSGFGKPLRAEQVITLATADAEGNRVRRKPAITIRSEMRINIVRGLVLPAQSPIAPGPLLPRPISPGRRTLRRATIGLGFIALTLGLAWLFHRPILTEYARLFRIDNPAPCDVIVMLLGGPESRPRKAAELYHEGLANKIYLCSGTPPGPGLLSEAIDAGRQMVRNGVPASAITLVQSPVASTRDEAMALLTVAKANGWKRLTVVTTSFHTRRALWVFHRVFARSGIEVRVAAAEDPSFNEQNWWTRDESAIIYFIETIKTLVYWIRY
jgi:uncharacterized SAM-binding protein YcdF (DUF218 family)